MQQAPQANTPGTLDTEEIDRFARLSSEWWDPRGKFGALHRIGPARLSFLRDEMVGHFGRRGAGEVGLRPLNGLSVLDVGCGGRAIPGPPARLGARVTGPPPALRN